MTKGKNDAIVKFSHATSEVYKKLKKQTKSKGSKTLYRKAQRIVKKRKKQGKL